LPDVWTPRVLSVPPDFGVTVAGACVVPATAEVAACVVLAVVAAGALVVTTGALVVTTGAVVDVLDEEQAGIKRAIKRIEAIVIIIQVFFFILPFLLLN